MTTSFNTAIYAYADKGYSIQSIVTGQTYKANVAHEWWTDEEVAGQWIICNVAEVEVVAEAEVME